AVRQDAVKRLIHNTAVLTTELGNRQIALKRLVGTGAQVVETLQQASPDLDATLRELGPTFSRLQSTLASVRGVVGDVDTGLTALTPGADKLPNGLQQLQALNRVLGPAGRSLRQPIKDIAPFVVVLTKVGRNASAIASNLTPQVPTLARLANDLVTCQRGVI